MKKLLCIVLTLAMLFSLVPAGFAEDIEIVDPEEAGEVLPVEANDADMEITVWVSAPIVEHTREKIRQFNETFAPAQPINATIVEMGEGEVAYELAADPETAADLFVFPQDQLAGIVRDGFLDKLGAEEAQAVKEENSGSSVDAATYHGELYAYPMTSDNGYFMYYDKSVIAPEHLDSLDRIVRDCEDAGKKVYFEASSGWYLAAFFFGAGCVSNWDPEGDSWTCTDTFDSEQGLIAAKGLKSLTDSDAFVDSSSGVGFYDDAAVVISGIWDYQTVLEALGDNLGAAKLPSFTVDNGNYQMGSFSGCKLLGVKPQEDADRAAELHALAQYLSGEEAQLERYGIASWGPSNLSAQADPAVQAHPALAALQAQNVYSMPQGQIPGFWWGIASELSIDIRSAGSDEELRAALAKYRQQIEDIMEPGGIIASGECGLEGDNLTWALDDTGLLKISGTGEMMWYDDFGGPWLEYEEQVLSLVIEEGATSISSGAFHGCEHLKNVVIPGSVQTIGVNAFTDCTSLENLSLGEGLQSTSFETFAGCAALRNLTLPDSLTEVGIGSFLDCSGLTEVKFGSGLTTIWGSAFMRCSSLEEIAIPAGVTRIDTGAFSNCTSLKAIEVDEENASYKSVDGALFSKDGTVLCCCPGGKTGSYTVPTGVSTIGKMAFRGCVNLTEIVMTNNVTTINSWAFVECDGLTEITIPASVTTLERDAFLYCTNLENIWVEEGNMDYKSIDGVLFYNYELLYCCPNGRSGDYTVPDGTRSIAREAFYSCKKLTSVTMPDTVGEIGDSAFSDCTSLENVRLPVYLGTLGAVFANCTALKSITIPQNVWRIWYHTFYNCTGLESIYFRGNAPEMKENCFEGVTATAYYPSYEDSWTEEKMKDYLGEITWVPYVPIRFDQEQMTIPVKESKQLALVFEDGTELDSTYMQWRSSDENVATVDEYGKVTAKKYGKCEIIAYSWDGDIDILNCEVQTLFWDVADPSQYYFKHVYWAAEKGITKGYDLEYFAPQEECTREQMMTFLWRLAGQPEPTTTSSRFPDVKKGAYYYKAVLWGVEKKITAGYSSGPYAGKFGVSVSCTREQAMTFLWRMANKPEPQTTTNKFKDVKSSDYFYKAVLWASENGIANGYSDGTYGVGLACLREHMVTFLSRYASKYM